jgi:hypothetical protein
MDKPKGEFDPLTKKTIKNELFVQLNLAFEKLDESARKYNQYIFIVNAGGAAATLAFLGTKTGSTFAIWPLLFFVAGVIVCGINLLASFYVNKEAFNDALNRRTKFSETNKIESLYPEKGEMEKWTSYRIADWAGYIAYGLFIAGVIAGGFAYLWSPSPSN